MFMFVNFAFLQQSSLLKIIKRMVLYTYLGLLGPLLGDLPHGIKLKFTTPEIPAKANVFNKITQYKAVKNKNCFAHDSNKIS